MIFSRLSQAFTAFRQRVSTINHIDFSPKFHLYLLSIKLITNDHLIHQLSKEIRNRKAGASGIKCAFHRHLCTIVAKSWQCASVTSTTFREAYIFHPLCYACCSKAAQSSDILKQWVPLHGIALNVVVALHNV